MVLQPFLTPPIHNRHEIALAVVPVLGVGSVVEVSLVKNDSDESVLSSRLGILEGFEPKLMVDVSLIEDVVEELVLDLNLIVEFTIWIGTKLRLIDW
jgi:hypothetical protein